MNFEYNSIRFKILVYFKKNYFGGRARAYTHRNIEYGILIICAILYDISYYSPRNKFSFQISTY